MKVDIAELRSQVTLNDRLKDICTVCRSKMRAPGPGEEHTPTCDSCAHDIVIDTVPKLLDELQSLRSVKAVEKVVSTTPKKKRGRPKGSKNKPKVVVVAKTEEIELESPPFKADDGGLADRDFERLNRYKEVPVVVPIEVAPIVIPIVEVTPVEEIEPPVEEKEEVDEGILTEGERKVLGLKPAAEVVQQLLDEEEDEEIHEGDDEDPPESKKEIKQEEFDDKTDVSELALEELKKEDELRPGVRRRRKKLQVVPASPKQIQAAVIQLRDRFEK